MTFIQSLFPSLPSTIKNIFPLSHDFRRVPSPLHPYPLSFKSSQTPTNKLHKFPDKSMTAKRSLERKILLLFIRPLRLSMTKAISWCHPAPTLSWGLSRSMSSTYSSFLAPSPQPAEVYYPLALLPTSVTAFSHLPFELQGPSFFLTITCSCSSCNHS